MQGSELHTGCGIVKSLSSSDLRTFAALVWGKLTHHRVKQHHALCVHDNSQSLSVREESMEGLKGRTAAFPGDTVLTEPGPGRDGCRHSDAHTPRFPGAESRAVCCHRQRRSCISAPGSSCEKCGCVSVMGCCSPVLREAPLR